MFNHTHMTHKFSAYRPDFMMLVSTGTYPFANINLKGLEQRLLNVPSSLFQPW